MRFGTDLLLPTLITILITGICTVSIFPNLRALDKCILSRNAIYTLSNFNPLCPGPIIDNSLLNIKEKTFNFSVRCPLYDKTPLVSLKYGYIIPVYHYETSISYSDNYSISHYEFKELEEGDYSIHFTGGSKQCIFNTTDKIDSHIPYREKDIFSISDITLGKGNIYNSSFQIQGSSFVFLASLDPFVVRVDSDTGKIITSYNISNYRLDGDLLRYYLSDVIYSGNLETNITLTIIGKRVTYWVNTDGLFYKNNPFHNNKCNGSMETSLMIALSVVIIMICSYIILVLLILYINCCTDKNTRPYIEKRE